MHQLEFDALARNNSYPGIKSDLDPVGGLERQRGGEAEFVGQLIARQYAVDLFSLFIIIKSKERSFTSR